MAEAPRPSGSPLVDILSRPEPPLTGTTPVGTPAPTKPSLLADLLSTPDTGPLITDPALAGELMGELPPGEKLRAVATGTALAIPSGLMIGGTTAAGMYAGAPLGPLGMIGLGLAGMAVGSFSTIPLNKMLESDTPPRYFNDPRLIPYYQGGKTFGMTIGAAPTAFSIPTVQGGRIASMITNMGNEARAYPVGTLMGETVSATGAGIAGGSVLAYDPTAEGARMGAEVVGGMFTPVLRLVTSAARNSSTLFDSVKQRFSPDAREYKAAVYLRDLFAQTGEDPEKLVRRLTEQLPPGVPQPSAAQKTGSLALSVLETTLAKGNPAFNSQINAQGKDAFLAFENMIAALRATGDPAALQQAARAEREFFRSMLTNRMRTAEENSASAIRQIRVDSPETRARIGGVVRQQVEDALFDAREYERALWRQAELDAVNVTLGPRGLEDAVVTPRMLTASQSSRGMLDALTSVTPEYLASMPGSGTAQAIAARFGATGDALGNYRQGRLSMQFLETRRVPDAAVTGVREVPVSYMIQARGDLLGLSRQAASTGDTNAARIYGEMADAILNDLDALQTPAYDRARQYSRELNDFFSRSYARDILRVTGEGAQRLPPEILVQRAFGSNNDLTNLRMEQVMGAVRSLNTRYERLLAELGPDHPQVQELAPFAGAAAERANTVGAAQRELLLLAANKSLIPDPNRPGQVILNRDSLQKFISDPENRRQLTAAGLITDLENVQTADILLRQTIDGRSAFNQNVNSQTAFGRVLGTESPVRAVTDALSSRFPVRQMTRLIRLAQRGRTVDGNRVEGALDGLKSVLYDYAYTAAGGQNGNFSPTAFHDALFEPLSRGQPSVMTMLFSRNAVTAAEKNNIKRLLLPMMQIENAMGNRQQLDSLLQSGTSPVQEIALRLIGSKLGRLGGGSGESLVLAGAGSRMLRDAVQNQPTVMITEILQQASKDPQFMASLVQRVTPQTSASTTEELLKRLSAQSRINGLTLLSATMGVRQQYEPVEQQESGAYTNPPRPIPPAPDARGVPGVPGGTPAPAPGGTPAPAPAGGAPVPPQAMNSRQMLQRLFPFDSTLSA